MEASGGYEKEIAKWLKKQGHAHPPRYARRPLPQGAR